MQRPTCGSTGNISNCQDDPTHLPTHFPGSRESGNRAAGAIVMHAPLQPEVLAVIELIIKQRCRDLGAFEVGRVLPFAKRRMIRSEEHTSELQSLMRISYAVFCLKKTKPR